MTAVAVAMLLAGAVALLVRPAPPTPIELRGDGSRGVGLGVPWTASSVGGVLLALTVLDGTQRLLAAIAVLAAAGGRALVLRQRAAAQAAEAAQRVTEFCESLAAELVAGSAPATALASCAEDFAEFGQVAGAARLDADVPDALRRLALVDGCADLRLVAAAWQVSSRSGAGLAGSLSRVGRTLREQRRTARLVAAELASAYATARIMAGLPVLFVLAGAGLGANPLGFLLGSVSGALCLGAGLALTWAGLAWLQRIARTVTSS